MMNYVGKKDLTLNSSEDDLLEVAWYLSKYGKSQPPVGLGVLKWKEAYDLFYPRFGWMNDQAAETLFLSSVTVAVMPL